MGEEPDALTGRAAQMERSLGAALRGRGVPTTESGDVLTAYALAMEPRINQLDDDHHPAWLHPGRSVLVLLHDVESVDPTGLVIAALHESMDPPLRVPADRLEDRIGSAAARAIDQIPLPGDERLAERLLLLSRGLALATLAERLDHLRHLHMREETVDHWAALHEEASRVWLPVAARLDRVLWRRYAHWTRTFARRL